MEGEGEGQAVDRVHDAAAVAGGVDLSQENDVNEILQDWRGRLRQSPDVRPRTGERGQREQALVRALLGAASFVCSPGNEQASDEDRLQTLVLMSALYGANKPRERLDPQALCEELAELRHAVWHYLRVRKLAPEIATDCILHFDRALSVALRAAIAGGYRADIAEVASQCDLPETLRALVTDGMVTQSGI